MAFNIFWEERVDSPIPDNQMVWIYNSEADDSIPFCGKASTLGDEYTHWTHIRRVRPNSPKKVKIARKKATDWVKQKEEWVKSRTPEEKAEWLKKKQAEDRVKYGPVSYLDEES